MMTFPNSTALPANFEDRWEFVEKLDESLLKGGVVLSEWCSRIVREADIAFVHGANLATILTAVSAIETHLRAESGSTGRERLVDLIDRTNFPAALKSDLQALRVYRNRWVHVRDPEDDTALLSNPESMDSDLEMMACFAVRTLRSVIYGDQCV